MHSPVGTKTEYLWMFISRLVQGEANIFHMGIAAGEQQSDTDTHAGHEMLQQKRFLLMLFPHGVT